MTPAEMAALHRQVFTTPRPWSELEFATLMEAPSTIIETAQHGFAMARQVADEAELLTITVDPKCQRTGFGRVLMQGLLDQLTSTRTVFLEVSETNLNAIAFYKAIGFQHSGTRKNYYRAPEGRKINALIFSKQL
ncbi:MAG: GNAT family N-acetyltransferase [Pseudomonadota bacterium]